jgi:hypothetical protein
MLRVSVAEAGKKSETIRAGQVRKYKDGSFYCLVVKDGVGGFNAIKLTNETSVELFETCYAEFRSEDKIAEDFPTVVDAELTIKGA